MVQIKLAGDKHSESIPIKVERIDGAGVWLQSAYLLAKILETDPSFRQAHYEMQPYIFVPLTQVEWILVPDKIFR
jgi:hypothetical protein